MMNTNKNKLYAILGLLSFFMGITSCKDANNLGSEWTPSLDAHYLYTETSSLQFGSATSSSNISVRSVSIPWLFSGMDSWLSLSTEAGNTSMVVEALAAENKSADDIRTNVFYLKSTFMEYPYNKPISATQSKAVPYITLSKVSVPFTVAGGTEIISVNANTKYSVKQTSSTEDWLSVSTSSDKITISVVANTSAEVRSAVITLVGATSKTVTVTQQGAIANLISESNISFDNSANTSTVSFVSEAAWNAISSESWIDLSPINGSAGQNDLTISVAPNNTIYERSGIITIRIGVTNMIQIKVTQAGCYLMPSVSSLMFEADVESQTLDISSNITWRVVSKPQWISVSTLEHSGSTTVTLTASGNNNTESRSGQIVFSADGLSLSSSVDVTQKGREFGNLTGSIQFAAKAGSEILHVKTDGQWTASVDKSWLSISPVQGKGDSDITVSAQENTGDEPRSAVISVSVGETTQTVVVTQQGHYFTVSSSESSSIPSTGGIYHLTIKTDEEWTAKKSASWLTLSADSGTGDIDVSIAVADNASMTMRSDTLIFTPVHLQPVKIVVQQAARYLRVDNNQISFFAKGGISNAINVETDGTYIVKTSDAWFAVDKSGNILTVSAEENLSAETRAGTITISLTDLADDETYSVIIPVVQVGQGEDFGVNPFPTDEDWNF